MHVKFFLRDISKEGAYSKKSKEHLVNAYFTYHGQRIRLSTKLRVNKNDWNEKREEFRGFGDDVATKNATLKKIRQKADGVYNTLMSKGIPLTANIVKKEILKEIFPEKYVKTEKVYNLFNFLEWYIKENPNNVKLGTMKANMQIIPLLKDISKKEGDLFLEFEQVTNPWESAFKTFLINKGHGKNTIGRHIKNIKSLMTLAYKKKLHTNTEYREFKKTSEETKAIYLTEEEILSIYNTDLPSHLVEARDVFVFSCLTGLRFSDTIALRKYNWKGDFLEITTIKTEDALKIPLRKTAKIILEKYKGQIPYFYNQKYNRQIKEICSKVDSLKVDETYTITKGSKRKEIVIKKYKLVQSHTARRSFATNEYKRGTKTAIIMAVTGHKSERDFWTYIRLKQTEKAEDLFEDFQKRDF